ncbi:hypothetical protein [Methylibium sp.]|uniref:hypothetical protein n=1 Tax=Methylibium sp. TaxID=2067992 RepID=UPI0017B6090B|nr:hypothetical protein [Methylibium sp.]MBA3591560.1 hypothetical protein [Methylibium sp.]
MDPAAILSQLWTIGPSAALLGLAVFYFYKRDKRNDTAAEARHQQCETRNAQLDARILALEDRQFLQLAAIARDGMTGLANSTAAIKRFMRDDTPTPPDAFPIQRPGHP